MTFTIVRPHTPFSIVRQDGPIRVNTGGPGLRGLPGADGAPGAGMVAGGTIGQIYVKKSAVDHDAEWRAPGDIIGLKGLYPRGGSFSSLSGDSLLASVSLSTGAVVNTSYNAFLNSAAWVDQGKFIQNNNDFGGTAGAMNASVVDLCNRALATGDPTGNYRYGPSWHVLRITAGAGTTSAGSGAFAGTYSVYMPFQTVLVSEPTTFKMWARKVSGGANMNIRTETDADLRVDGAAVAISSGHWAFPDAAWHFFDTRISPRSIGYVIYSLRLFGNAGDVFEVALPDFSPGSFYPAARGRFWTPENRT